MDGAPTGTVADEGISPDELRLAARNHGLPLEALRYPITPAGLHYLLIHYDIPAVDPQAYRLEIGGAVARPLSLSLDDLRERERVAMPVTFECAGNGRALLQPAPAQPALADRGGRHRRVGRHAAAPAARGGGCAGVGGRGALHRARPRRRGRGRAGLRALAGAARRRARAARLRDERRAAAAAARPPAAPRGAGLVRHDEREVARPHHPDRGAVPGLPAVRGLPPLRRRRRAGRAGQPHAAALADGAARRAGLPDPRAHARARAGGADRARLVGPRPDRAGRGVHRRRRRASRRPCSTSRSARPHGAAGASTGTPRRAGTCSARGPRTRPATPSRSSRPGT